MIMKVGIVGISGYSGVTTLKLLLNHPDIRVTYVSANNTEGEVSKIWPELAGRTSLVCKKFNLDSAIDCDILFLAVPHKVALTIVPKLLDAKNDLRIIDLSADYRLKDKDEYNKWYDIEHNDEKYLSQAVYGLPELYREDIKNSNLIANPGCYPTAALLSLLPLSTGISFDLNIVIDAKSGVTGAGRKAKTGLLFSEVNEDFYAYKVLKHQHTPEIKTYLNKFLEKNININFVPHLLPINRGILETVYVRLKQDMDLLELHKVYTKFYKTEPFVNVLPLGEQPHLKYIVNTNYCNIGLTLSEDKKLLVITSAIDNLVKGAAGQAVQNMNIMCGFKEETGLL